MICIKMPHIPHLYNLASYWWIIKLNVFFSLFPSFPHSSVFKFHSWIIFRHSDTEAEDAGKTKAELYIQDYLRSPPTNLIWLIPVFCISILVISLWPVIRDLFLSQKSIKTFVGVALEIQVILVWVAAPNWFMPAKTTILIACWCCYAK